MPIVEMNSLANQERKWVHEINPRVKLLWLLSYGTVFFTDNVYLLTAACLVAVTIFLVIKAFKSTYRYGIFIMLFFLGIIGLVALIKYSVSSDITEITSGSLMILKWLSIILSSVIFFIISSPYEITSILRSLRAPEVVSFSLGIGFRFIPIVVDEFHKTLLAQKARGLDSIRGLRSVLKMPLIVRSITIPLLRNLIIKMENLWISLNLRGIEIENFLFKEKSRFTVKDYLFGSYSTALILLSIIY